MEKIDRLDLRIIAVVQGYGRVEAKALCKEIFFTRPDAGYKRIKRLITIGLLKWDAHGILSTTEQEVEHVAKVVWRV